MLRPLSRGRLGRCDPHALRGPLGRCQQVGIVRAVRLIGLPGDRGSRRLRGDLRAWRWWRRLPELRERRGWGVGRPLRRTGRPSGRAGGGTDLENEPRAALRIADRDRLTGPDVDRRRPRAVDVHAAGAAVDGYPVAPGKAQHHLRARCRRWRGGAARALQRDVDPSAVAHQHVAAGGKDVPQWSDPNGQRGGRTGGSLRPHHRHLSSPVRPSRLCLRVLIPRSDIDSSVYPLAVV